jgi:pyruvate,water dikinase
MTTTDTPFVLRIDDPAAVGSPLLGGKFGSLAEMTAAGFAVPPGFGITTTAYRYFLAESGLSGAARTVRAEARGADLARVQELSSAITAQIEAASVPPALEEAIRDSYAELEKASGSGSLAVAVRSSGESEDLAGASFAGQYDTFLWIRGVDDVLTHVRKCWAGMFGPAVLTYRPEATADAALADHGICVGVQQMVEARSAGVMFTLDPVTGDRSKVVVEGCWGLGEGVVGGGVTPSRFVVDKVTFEIVRRELIPQESAYGVDPATGTVGLVPVAEERRAAPCLTDEEIDTLVKLAKRIERHRGAPQDIEWAVDEEDQVHVLQVRPETVWSQREAPSVGVGAKSAVELVLGTFVTGGRLGDKDK